MGCVYVVVTGRDGQILRYWWPASYYDPADYANYFEISVPSFQGSSDKPKYNSTKVQLGGTCEFIVFIYRASVRGHLEESGWLQSRHTAGNSHPSMDGSFL